MRMLKSLVMLVIVLAVVGLVILYSGAYNVAASTPHSELGRWALNAAKQRSVAVRAADVTVPELNDSHLQQGFGHYPEMCEGCHGAPGVEPAELAQGMTPRPPELAETAANWSDAELFWIIKHGIRMTGMPAWGETHDDESLWGLVAVVKRLPELSAQEYAQRKAATAQSHPHGGGGAMGESGTDPGGGHGDGESGEPGHVDDGHNH